MTKITLEISDEHYVYLEKYFVDKNKAKTKDEVEAFLTAWLSKVIENRALEQYRKEVLEEAEANMINL